MLIIVSFGIIQFACWLHNLLLFTNALFAISQNEHVGLHSIIIYFSYKQISSQVIRLVVVNKYRQEQLIYFINNQQYLNHCCV